MSSPFLEENDFDLHNGTTDIFCQEITDVDFKHMELNSPSIEHTDNNTPLVQMIEKSIASALTPFLESIPDELQETTTILIHSQKKEGKLSISIDTYNSRHGIADRQYCEAVESNGDLIFDD